MSLMQRCHCLHLRLEASLRGHAVTAAGAAGAGPHSRAMPRPSRRPLTQSPMFRAQRVLGSNCWSSGGVLVDSCGISGKSGESKTWSDTKITASATFGEATAIKWFSASARNNPKETDNKRRRPPIMSKCHSIEEASSKMFDHLDIIDHGTLSAFWTRVAQLVAKGKRGKKNGNKITTGVGQEHRLEAQLKAIFAKTMEEMQSFQSRDMAQTALGFAKTMKAMDKRKQKLAQGTPRQILHELLIGSDSERKDMIFRSIANASSPLLPKFPARMLANLAYAYAIAGIAPTLDDGSNLFDRIAECSVPLVAKFAPQGLTNMVWSFKKLEASNPRLFKAVADHIVALDHLNEFKPQALANMVWAFAKAGETNYSQLFEKVARHIVGLECLEEFQPQHLSNIVWACTKAEEVNPELFEKVVDHIVEDRNLREFDAQAIANIVWAFAKAGRTNPMLFDKVADEIVEHRNLREFNAQELANTVWAFAKAGRTNPKLFDKVADHIVEHRNLNEFDTQALANTVWAFATAEESNPQLFRKVADHILALDNLHSFNSATCSQILWGFSTADIINVPLFEKVAAYAMKNIDFKKLDKQSQMSLLRAFEKAEHASRKK